MTHRHEPHHRHHVDCDDRCDHLENTDDDNTWALKAAFWLLAVVVLGFLLGVILLREKP